MRHRLRLAPRQIAPHHTTMTSPPWRSAAARYAADRAGPIVPHVPAWQRRAEVDARATEAAVHFALRHAPKVLSKAGDLLAAAGQGFESMGLGLR
jgi:hypothetical protein